MSNLINMLDMQHDSTCIMVFKVILIISQNITSFIIILQIYAVDKLDRINAITINFINEGR